MFKDFFKFFFFFDIFSSDFFQIKSKKVFFQKKTWKFFDKNIFIKKGFFLVLSEKTGVLEKKSFFIFEQVVMVFLRGRLVFKEEGCQGVWVSFLNKRERLVFFFSQKGGLFFSKKKLFLFFAKLFFKRLLFCSGKILADILVVSSATILTVFLVIGLLLMNI